MASPTPLSIEARRLAWASLWRALLADPPTEHAPEQPATDDDPDSDAADEAA